MNRRTFALSLVGLALPLVAGTSEAQQAKKAPAPGKPPPAPGAPLTTEEIVSRVQAKYDEAKTFKSGFRQRYRVKAYDKTKDSAGSVMFEKPGKMSWRYTSNGNRVVSDGKLIKIYEKDNKQMYEQPLDKSQYPAALSFLTGQGKLNDNFNFSKLDSKQMKFESGYVLLGLPRQPTAAYDKVYFYVDAQSYLVRRVIIQDTQQNRNTFDFVGQEVNTKPPQGEFAFTPPPGTSVIRP